ncbi:phage tail protein I [Nguyenibacter vanlangensis]|uniref:Phage tail protein I n=1 Tax=Nguyenibacter vanlangensis TaxID=1216886 RepID=A0ABZ3D293_9PROT
MSESLLPPNATPLESAMEMAAADQLATIPQLGRTVNNPATIPVQWLPWLAWAWRVENWDNNWSEAQKRQTVAASFAVHRQKGTAYAVKSAIGALNLNLQIVEWFADTPVGAPYTFRGILNIESTDVANTDWANVMNIINTTKNARSVLSSIDMAANLNCETVHAGATCFGMTISV